MKDVTLILNALEQGENQAAYQLLPAVYRELRQLAAQKLTYERPGHTLQATALVHEAYMRLMEWKAGILMVGPILSGPRPCGAFS